MNNYHIFFDPKKHNIKKREIEFSDFYSYDSLYKELGYVPLLDNKSTTNINKNSSSIFESKAFNNAMLGIGVIGSTLSTVGSIYNAYKTDKYNKKLLALDEQERREKRQTADTFNKGFNKFLEQNK